jgi:hypothetical protein
VAHRRSGVWGLVRERDNNRVMLTGDEGRRWGLRIETTMKGNIDGRQTSSGVVYKRGGEIWWFWVLW